MKPTKKLDFTAIYATLTALALITIGALWLIAPVWQPGFRANAASMPLPGTAGSVSTEAQPIDINTATAQELQQLPGVGEKRAEDIVAYRSEHGPFSDLQELTAISGISDRMVESWQGLAVVGTNE